MKDSKELMQFLGQQQPRFNQLNSHQAVKWEAECLYARQQLLKNEYTFKAAANNPGSLQSAILNVASVGISLNPALQHAYLVPRDGAICLDISYRGMVKLATDSDAIKDCKSVLVYANDVFIWKGPYEMPDHQADPFSTDRGEVKGAYNIARMSDGSVMVDTVDRAYLDKVRGTSKAANGPWKQWPEEMMLKTVTRHASKSWPPGKDRERFDAAVQVMDESEGLAFSTEDQNEYMGMLRDGKALEFYLWCRQQPESKVIALYNSFDKGQKVKQKQLADETMAKGRDLADEAYSQWSDLLAIGDTDGANQIREDWSDDDWREICIAGGGEVPDNG